MEGAYMKHYRGSDKGKKKKSSGVKVASSPMHAKFKKVPSQVSHGYGKKK